jgi:uncharacterized protein YoxC
MAMSPALQVALFLASLAVIGLAIFVIYVSYQARAQLKQLSSAAEQMKADLKVLLQHSQELISHVTEVSRRVSEQVDEVETVVKTVRHWTERADRVVEEVGSAIEPPIFAAVRNMNLFRKGAAAFLQALFHIDQNNRHNANTQQEREEEGHV